MSDIALGTIAAYPPQRASSLSMDITVIVAHASPLIRAGIVSTLKRLPRCAVQIWERGPVLGRRAAGRAQVVIGDEDGVSQILQQTQSSKEVSYRTKVVVMTTGDSIDARGLASRRMDQQLSVGCEEEELFDAVRMLSGRAAEERATRRADRGGLAPHTLRRVREHIENRLTEHITLGELAAIAGLCEGHFSRAFKQSIGMPPHRFVIQRRIEKAMELIETTELTLCEIAHAIGFADQSHFTRLFVETVGEPPRSFRHRLR